MPRLLPVTARRPALDQRHCLGPLGVAAMWVADRLRDRIETPMRTTATIAYLALGVATLALVVALIAGARNAH